MLLTGFCAVLTCVSSPFHFDRITGDRNTFICKLFFSYSWFTAPYQDHYFSLDPFSVSTSCRNKCLLFFAILCTRLRFFFRKDLSTFQSLFDSNAGSQVVWLRECHYRHSFFWAQVSADPCWPWNARQLAQLRLCAASFVQFNADLKTPLPMILWSVLSVFTLSTRVSLI